MLRDSLLFDCFISALPVSPPREISRARIGKTQQAMGAIPNVYWENSPFISGIASTIWADCPNRSASPFLRVEFAGVEGFTVGPNEMTICDISVLEPALGSNGMPKGPSMSCAVDQLGNILILFLNGSVERSHKRTDRVDLTCERAKHAGAPREKEAMEQGLKFVQHQGIRTHPPKPHFSTS